MFSSQPIHPPRATRAPGEEFTRLRVRVGKSRRRWAVLVTLLLVHAAASASAQSNEAVEEDEPEALFQVQKIEVRVFGAYTGGDTFLELPPVTSDLTSDTASDEILDFNGNPAEDLGLAEAPTKELESGWRAGIQSTFYLSEAFGMYLRGIYGQSDAVLTGQRTVRGDTEEFDRTTVTIFEGGGGVIYHIGNARKLNKLRPYVNLGFSGILHNFENVDSVSELTFTAGGGVTFPITGNFRGQFGLAAQLYSWETEEVSLDETMLIPQVSLGVVWRYDVPSASQDAPGEGES